MPLANRAPAVETSCNAPDKLTSQPGPPIAPSPACHQAAHRTACSSDCSAKLHNGILWTQLLELSLLPFIGATFVVCHLSRYRDYR